RLRPVDGTPERPTIRAAGQRSGRSATISGPEQDLAPKKRATGILAGTHPGAAFARRHPSRGRGGDDATDGLEVEEVHPMTDDRISQFVTEAKRMRYSRRGIAKRAAALGLGSSAIAAALTATGRTVGAKPNRAPAFLQERSLT